MEQSIDVYLFGEKIARFVWNGTRVNLEMIIHSKIHEEILNEIFNSKHFFNPETDVMEENYDAKDDMEVFIIKATPQLIKYCYYYEIIE